MEMKRSNLVHNTSFDYNMYLSTFYPRLCGLLPAIHGVGTKTNLTQQLMDLALKGFHAYKETAIFEWYKFWVPYIRTFKDMTP